MVETGSIWHDGRRRWLVVAVAGGLVTVECGRSRRLVSPIWLRRECRRRG